MAAPASADTILPRVKAAPAEPEPAYRCVGIDDFALRKGHTYGTILVDLERGRVIDILDGCDGSAVEGWLKAHPGVEVSTRDRWSAYANAATAGSPRATQVADRWHLLRNLREAIEQLFERSAAVIRDALVTDEPAADPGAAPTPPVAGPVNPANQPQPMPAGVSVSPGVRLGVVVSRRFLSRRDPPARTGSAGSPATLTIARG